ncbi:hypothetical protein QYM36_002946, partial [Artemia franciscana]
MAKVDEEAAMRNQSQKQLRELESQLEVEKAARQKAEKNRIELNEELEALKNKLLDSLATTTSQQELRTKCEQELALLKKSIEEESRHHESQLMEMRHKYSQEMVVLHEQINNAKKIEATLEKAKATLEAENADMPNEIKSIATSKAETDKKRKHLESQLTSHLQESERARSEVQDRLVHIQTDMESLTAQLVDTESRSVNAAKSNANTEQQLNEMQTQLEVETKQKLALNTKIRQLESEKESLHYQVEDAKEAKTLEIRVCTGGESEQWGSDTGNYQRVDNRKHFYDRNYYHFEFNNSYYIRNNFHNRNHNPFDLTNFHRDNFYCRNNTPYNDR